MAKYKNTQIQDTVNCEICGSGKILKYTNSRYRKLLSVREWNNSEIHNFKTSSIEEYTRVVKYKNTQNQDTVNC